MPGTPMTPTSPFNSSGVGYGSIEKGRVIYSWEATMKHHCGKCYQKIKHTCIVEHMVVCSKYHAMLFSKGGEGNCKSCNESAQDREQKAGEVAIALQHVSGIGTIESSAQNLTLNAQKLTKKEKKQEKTLERTKLRKRSSMSAHSCPEVAAILQACSSEGGGTSADGWLVNENMRSLLKFSFWPSAMEPDEEDAKVCAEVLAALGLRCICYTDQEEKARGLSRLLHLIIRAIDSINVEAEGVNARMYSFERVTSRKTAEAMKGYLRDKGYDV